MTDSQLTDAQALATGRAILELIAAAVRDAGHEVVVFPGAVTRVWSMASGDPLTIDGVPVPLRIEPEYTYGYVSGTARRSGVPTGKFKVRCEWVWDSSGASSSPLLSARTFPSAKSRPETCGIAVATVAAHLIQWCEVTRKAEQLAALTKRLTTEWSAVATRLRAAFPVHASAIEHDARGIQLTLTVSESQAEAVFAALGKRKD